MEAKKRINVSIPLGWPSAAGWKRIARWLLPSPGTVIFVAVLLWGQSAGALPLARQAVPASPSTTTISYQGRLADAGGTPIDGPVTLQFALYATDVDPTPLWGPETHPNVPVAAGLFSVALGAEGSGIPLEVLGGDLWLEVVVNGETLSPRERLGAVPYAMQAMTVPDGAIHNRNLALSYWLASPENQVAITSTNPDAPNQVVSTDVDFAVDGVYLFFAKVISTSDSVNGRLRIEIWDENGMIGKARTYCTHPVAGTDGAQECTIATLIPFTSGAHTVRLVATMANGASGSVLSASELIVIPLGQP
jgi:hypothetical protein